MPDKIDVDALPQRTWHGAARERLHGKRDCEILVGGDLHLLEMALAERDATADALSAMKAERDDLWKRIERHETSYSDMLHRAADETSRLRADLERARDALLLAEGTFRHYGHLHALKGESGAAKAAANNALADRMRAALANPSETPNGSAPPPVTDEMAEVLRETLRDLGNGSVSLAHARAALTEALGRKP